MSKPKLFRVILVAIGAEDSASDALMRGLTLARELEARVHVVHAVEVVPELGRAEELAAFRADALERARERAGQLLELALRETDFDGGSADELLRVLPGHPGKVILDEAQRLEADAVVLGRHVHRAAFGFGSTARVVLARAEVPVWNQIGSCMPLRRIVVPVDFSDASREALHVARALAEHTRATLRLVHCHTPGNVIHAAMADGVAGIAYLIAAQRQAAEEELQRWQRELLGTSVASEADCVDGQTAEQIVASAHDAELIVMGSHGRTGLMRALLGSVAYRTLELSERPVLVVPSARPRWILE